MTNIPPKFVNADWHKAFIAVASEKNQSVDHIQMPTSKDMPKSFNILTEQWLDEGLFPPYSENRNVKNRLGKDHLNGISTGAQLQVVAVCLENHIFKIDGHSRAAAWLNDQLTKPTYLNLTIFKVDDLDEVRALYKQYNSRATAETSREATEHAHKVAKFEPTSDFMKKDLASVYPKIDAKYAGNETQATIDFKEHLEEMDSWKVLKSNKKGVVGYPTGIKTAMLWSLITYGKDVKDFWDRYADINNIDNPDLVRLRVYVINEKGNLSGNLKINYILNMAKEVLMKEQIVKSVA